MTEVQVVSDRLTSIVRSCQRRVQTAQGAVWDELDLCISQIAEENSKFMRHITAALVNNSEDNPSDIMFMQSENSLSTSVSSKKDGNRSMGSENSLASLFSSKKDTNRAPSKEDELLFSSEMSALHSEPLGQPLESRRTAPTPLDAISPSHEVHSFLGDMAMVTPSSEHSPARPSAHSGSVPWGCSGSGFTVRDANSIVSHVSQPSCRKTNSVASHAQDRKSARAQSSRMRESVAESIAQTYSGMSGRSPRQKSRGGKGVQLRALQRAEAQIQHFKEAAEHDGIEKAAARSAVFTNEEEMKDQVRSALLKGAYNVKSLYHSDGIAQWIARSSTFELLTLAVVFFNAIWVAIELDLNNADVIVNAEIHFIIAEHAFCAFFFGEVLVRFAAFRHKISAFHDGWFVFDSVLVALMVMETWIMFAVLTYSQESNSDATEVVDPSLLRLVRLVRLTRMARMARLLRWVPELLILLKGLLMASRSVFFTLVLLFFTIYIFALVFRQLTDGTPIGQEYFSTVSHSMISLLLRGVLPDLTVFVEDMGSEHILFAVLMLIFILIASLTVMNMLVGVLVEVVAMVSSLENEAMTVNLVRGKMLAMIEMLGSDVDGDGRMSKAEFEELLVQPEAAQFIQGVGVDVVGLVEFSEFIFKDRDLSFPEFVEIILALRGSNAATVKDVVDMRKQVMQEFDIVQQTVLDRFELMEKGLVELVTSCMIQTPAGTDAGCFGGKRSENLIANPIDMKTPKAALMSFRAPSTHSASSQCASGSRSGGSSKEEADVAYALHAVDGPEGDVLQQAPSIPTPEGHLAPGAVLDTGPDSEDSHAPMSVKALDGQPPDEIASGHVEKRSSLLY